MTHTVTSRPRGPKPPVAHAAIGVGVIVVDPRERILLGHHHAGVWELPGGSVEPGESLQAAAVRELREETSLAAAPADAEVTALLLDDAGGVSRLTAAVLVTAYEGEPVAAEPHLVARWQWFQPDALPGPLFVPSAQALTAWRPGLAIDHPPAHRYPIAF
ncbi:putative MutT-family protein [Streptomyces albireticuli]|uniref:Putative MutT-family protein n=1 Tax=Streptomyces albireticuli TaxID=1940 RepID=A0A1Z2LBJ6_9ACTN|nr:NUDIX hydrolase [Streptomyces albireticuli]ARZ71666.1 putative MutT-family protein [Streptomyces albireticuli]